MENELLLGQISGLMDKMTVSFEKKIDMLSDTFDKKLDTMKTDILGVIDQKLDHLKMDVAGMMEQQTAVMDEKMHELETRIKVTIENDVTKRIDVLFDGYTLTHEKQWELERKLEKLEQRIDRLEQVG